MEIGYSIHDLNMRLVRFFSPPVINKQEKEKKLYTASLIVLIAAFLSLLTLSILKLNQGRQLFLYDYLLFSLTVLIFCFILFLKKYVTFISVLFVFTSWAGMTGIAASSEGVHDASVIGYIVVIFYATLIAGYRFGLLMSVLSISSIWIMSYFEKLGYIEFQMDPTEHFTRDFTVIIFMTITLIFLYEKTFTDLYKKIENELAERIKAEQELIKNDYRLKEQNEEYLALNEELTESNLKGRKMLGELEQALEKAEESEKLKNAFLQNISHEIRTPLNGIIGFNELLKKTKPGDPRIYEYFEYIKSSSQNLTKLIDNLIEISRIDSGIIDLFITGFKLDELLNDLEMQFSEAAREKGLNLIIRKVHEILYIKTDRGRLFRILCNLVDNAIRFTPSGFVDITAEMEREILKIRIKDSGIGISKEQQEIIFHRFRQAEPNQSVLYGGTGLGLSISKTLTECLGGQISLSSEPNKGSAFVLSIPVEIIGMPADRADNHSFENESPRSLKVLVAEDEDINYYYFREILADKKCQVIRAKNGSEAIKQVQQNSDIDVIIMDLKMPEMDGRSAASLIKKINPAIPVLVVSAFPNIEPETKTAQNFFDGYLQKPVSPSLLFSRINDLVSH